MFRNRHLRKYFTFSRSERYGTVLLCGITLLMLVVKICLPYLHADKTSDFSQYEEEIALLRKSVESLQAHENTPAGEAEFHAEKAAYFYFDPNTASDEEWKKLGLNDRQVRNIRNYQAKGGSFRKKEDVKKLYTIPVVLYQSLEPYIRIQAGAKPASAAIPEMTAGAEPVAKAPAKNTLRIELNTADSALLTQLSGIGPVWASRIIKYRDLVGGFLNTEQLREIYGMDSVRFTRIKPHIYADSSRIRKIFVNKATFANLVRHPYLNKQQTNGILYYRKLQHTIKTMDELVKNQILTPEDAEKIAPYISFEQETVSD
ncbi:MAG: helix-hairpin-helix domain-containing protein [Bacteroidales bacterium]|jgi:competence ComEA-like helix-hairpin-helix protein|nr:helix-hairpin-helix domain-containing protein [Bacteroidales bacterium]